MENEPEEKGKGREANVKPREIRRESAVVDKNFEITIPSAIRKSLGIEPGDWLDIDLEGDGTITLQKAKMSFQELPPNLYQKVVDAVENKEVPFKTPEEFIVTAIEEKLSEDKKNN